MIKKRIPGTKETNEIFSSGWEILPTCSVTQIQMQSCLKYDNKLLDFFSDSLGINPAFLRLPCFRKWQKFVIKDNLWLMAGRLW